MSRAPRHFLTVDVEDWPQSTLDHSLPISDRVVASTRTVLELLDEAGVHGTFFVLGRVAEAHPALSREIHAAGHEVGTHGYSHRSAEKMPLGAFREELHRSVALLQDQTGAAVAGHRAADFSISGQSLHLLEVLCEAGLAYDSSIFPVRNPRYGVPGAWRRPHRVRCASGTLLEFPMATVRMAGLVLPAAGGGYLRLFPYAWTRLAFRRLESEGVPATCYMHPYEVDVREMEEIPYAVPRLLRWSQGANRKSVRRKLQRLLSSFQFTTMAEACEELASSPVAVGLDLTGEPVAYSSHPAPEAPC